MRRNIQFMSSQNLLSLSPLALSAALVLAACGSSPEDRETIPAALDASDSVSINFDTGLNPDAETSDVQADAEVDTFVLDPCAFPPDPTLGEANTPCSDPEDCDSGFCIETPVGKRCAKTCTACCPSGWRCEQAPGADTVFICLPKMGALCSPCVNDDTCEALAKGALCVAYKGDPVGGETRFCGGACAEQADCPSGYLCEERAGTKGQSKQCVRSAGLCECTPKALATGVQAACVVKNSQGSCSGFRICTKSGEKMSLSTCDAANPEAETCDGLDNDCDGKTDEELLPTPCKVSNKFGSCEGSQSCTEGINICDAESPQAEICDGVDNDCDGETDEGCDKDGDGYCASEAKILGLPASCTIDVAACNKSAALPAWCPKGIGDCDDSVATGAKVHPGAKELCGNKIDDNCDGGIDKPGLTADGEAIDPEGCTLYHPDVDGDGYGAVTISSCLCGPSKGFPLVDNTDCDDGDKLVHPNTKEICNNGKDDNCDNSDNDLNAIDCLSFYLDDDGDGYGKGVPKCLCAPQGSYKAKKGGDCNDNKEAIHPEAQEICNTIDDDCDEQTDEGDAKGCKIWYADGDKDGYGDKKKSACLCAAKAPYTTQQGGDCDDSKYTVNPAFKEICYDSLDNNCNNKIDEEGGQGCIEYWLDADGDGWGSDKAPKKCLCGKGSVPGYTASKGGDCDDNPATGKATHPMITEICDNKDNNCQGGVDEGCDDDNDGYCDTNMKIVGKPKICLHGGGDCCDLDAKTRPGSSGWYSAKNKCGSWDYNCSSYGERRWTTIAAPYHDINLMECLAKPQGWKQSVPSCGVNGTWITDYAWNNTITIPPVASCTIEVIQQRVQQCR